MPLEEISVGFELGPFSLSGTWKPSEKEKDASWDLYVELVTRITVQQLPSDSGLLREALSSLYRVFNTTRDILHKYGREVASDIEGELSFGYISISIINNILRPFTAKWHPLLLTWEDQRPDGSPKIEHEKNWTRNKEMRAELILVQGQLVKYMDILAQSTGVLYLHEMEIKEEKKS